MTLLLFVSNLVNMVELYSPWSGQRIPSVRGGWSAAPTPDRPRFSRLPARGTAGSLWGLGPPPAQPVGRASLRHLQRSAGLLCRRLIFCLGCVKGRLISSHVALGCVYRLVRS